MDKKTLCLYFQVHQPIRLRKYHFFDIGKNSDYYDDFANRTITRKVADRCYLPANRMMLELIRKYGKNFKVSFSISGMAIEQFREYAPEVIDSFKELVATGCVCNKAYLFKSMVYSAPAYRRLEHFTDIAERQFKCGKAYLCNL